MDKKLVCKKGFPDCSLYEACIFGSDEPISEERKVVFMLKELRFLPQSCHYDMRQIVFRLVEIATTGVKAPHYSIAKEFTNLYYLWALVFNGQKDRGLEACFVLKGL